MEWPGPSEEDARNLDGLEGRLNENHTFFTPCRQKKTRGAQETRLLGGSLRRSPSALVVSVDRYGTGVDPSKRSAPGFAVSGDGGVDPVALRPSHPAQRAGRGDQGRTADGTTRAAARCRSRHLHGRRDAHRRQCPACQMRAISTVFSTHLVCHRTSSRREESMVPGATSAKEGARVGVAHPSVTET
eukprot:3256118-Prymnesium_polylepis.1